MSPAPLQQTDFLAPAAVERIGRRSLVVGVLFGIVALLGAFQWKDAFYRAYLLGFMAWVGVSLGSLSLLLIIHLTNGRWGLVIRRILEAAIKNIWLMAPLFLPIYLGMTRLYPWARPDDITHEHLERISTAYLNPSQFGFRAVVYFVIWIGLGLLFTRWSRAEDEAGNSSARRARFLAGPGALVLAFTITFASVDWVMSITPNWTSTIYGLVFVIGQMLSALCFATVVAVILSRYKPMSELLHSSYLHDYGKFMLAFTMMWAYFMFSQWLIMWSGNLPEETVWYRNRLSGGWQYYSLGLALGNFVIPFLVLLSAQIKKKGSTLVKVAVWLMFTRFVDLYWLIVPSLSPGKFSPHILDLVVPVAIGGFWLALFFRNLRGQPLLPLYAPLTPAVLEPAHE
jgi:hypothetical protein